MACWCWADVRPSLHFRWIGYDWAYRWFDPRSTNFLDDPVPGELFHEVIRVENSGNPGLTKKRTNGYREFLKDVSKICAIREDDLRTTLGVGDALRRSKSEEYKKTYRNVARARCKDHFYRQVRKHVIVLAGFGGTKVGTIYHEMGVVDEEREIVSWTIHKERENFSIFLQSRNR